MPRWAALFFVVAASACASSGRTKGAVSGGQTREAHPSEADAGWTAVSIPGGAGGIGFDDVRYVPALDRVLVPAGHTGVLALLQPTTLAVEVVPGFTSQGAFRTGHDIGPTSADGGGGVVVVTDRTARAIDIVDAARQVIVSSTRLGAKPDLVRFVEDNREIWVSEPDGERIEVFALPAGPGPVPVHSGFIAAPGGPEGLTIDRVRGRAYTHLGPATVAVDLKTREVVTRWSTGCQAPTGIALDDAGGLLFVGCSDGQVAVVDLSTNRTVSRVPVGSSVDHIAFSSSLRHLYVPDTGSAQLTTLSVARDGQLAVLGTIATVRGTECVTTDDHGRAYLCDPEHGRILVVSDRYPSGARTAR